MNKQNPHMVPDENQMEELLAKIQPVPSKQFHTRIKQAAWHLDKGRRVQAIRLKAAFALVTLAMAAAFFLTPQGRVWAQELVQFFRKVNFTTIPVPKDEHNALNTRPEPYDLPLVPVFLPTPAPGMETLKECIPPQNIQSYACQIAYAELQLDMDLKEFPETPNGWIFQEVRFDKVLRNASIVYTHYSEHGGEFILKQGSGNFQSNYWDIVPAEEVEIVNINEFTGEYVSGIFSYREGDTAWRWDDDGSIQRLAWSDGDRWYYMEMLPPSPGYISRDDFVELATGLVDAAMEVADPPNPDSLSSIADAENYSGLDLKAPTMLPLGYEFSYARYFPVNHEVHLHYDHGSEDLVIYEWKGNPEDLDVLANIYKDHAFVNVGDRPALFGVPAAVPQYEASYLLLAWHDAGMNYRIYFYFNPDWGGGLLDQAKMIEIAESMSDINAVKGNATKPYEYVRIYEQALGIDIKEFAKTPEDWTFTDVSAHVRPDCIIISYNAEKEGGSLYLQQCKTQADMYYGRKDIPRNAMERVKIGRVTGDYIIGSSDVDENGNFVWNMESPYRTLRWQENGFWIYITLSGDSTVLYDKDDLISYAESLR